MVCLRVIEKDSREAREWATMSKDVRERAYRADAQRMLERIQEKNTEDRAINLVLEFSTGKIQETIQRMVSHCFSFLVNTTALITTRSACTNRLCLS